MTEGDRVYGRVVEGEPARLLGLADVGRRSSGRLAAGPAEDAAAALDAAEELLAREGFSFRDVARTWFTCATSWTGTARSTPRATPRSGGWD